MGNNNFALKKIILEDGKEINFESHNTSPESLQAAFGGSVVDGNWIAPEPEPQPYPDNAWEVYSIEDTKITFRNLNQPEILKGIEFTEENRKYVLPVIEQGVGAKFIIEANLNSNPSTGFIDFSGTILSN